MAPKPIRSTVASVMPEFLAETGSATYQRPSLQSSESLARAPLPGQLNAPMGERNRRGRRRAYSRAKGVPEPRRRGRHMNRRSFLTAAAAGAITPVLFGDSAFGQSAALPYDALAAI